MASSGRVWKRRDKMAIDGQQVYDKKNLSVTSQLYTYIQENSIFPSRIACNCKNRIGCPIGCSEYVRSTSLRDHPHASCILPPCPQVHRLLAPELIQDLGPTNTQSSKQ